MVVNNNINIDDLVKVNENSFSKRRINGLLLSDEDIIILDKYHIDYKMCHSMKELIFNIMNYTDNNDDCSDLEQLNIKFSEFDYYHNTNK